MSPPGVRVFPGTNRCSTRGIPVLFVACTLLDALASWLVHSSVSVAPIIDITSSRRDRSPSHCWHLLEGHTPARDAPSRSSAAIRTTACWWDGVAPAGCDRSRRRRRGCAAPAASHQRPAEELGGVLCRRRRRSRVSRRPRRGGAAGW